MHKKTLIKLSVYTRVFLPRHHWHLGPWQDAEQQPGDASGMCSELPPPSPVSQPETHLTASRPRADLTFLPLIPPTAENHGSL